MSDNHLANKDPQRATREPGVYLAAFGKHPGWDDHIDDLGIETALLASIKRDLYISGIGTQLDSGAWEKLSEEQRLEGFHHDFIWIVQGQAIAGHMWASRDGKGRSKYPMVVAAQCTGGGIHDFLSWAQPVLDQLEEQCRDATAATTVISAVDLARERLRAAARSIDPTKPPLPPWAITSTALADFVQQVDGEDWRRAFHRLLHKLEPRMVARDGKDPAETLHVRLPLDEDEPLRAMTLWLAVFRMLVGSAATVLLLRPVGEACLDVIIGEPVSSQLYCLLASRKAIPLTTDIPFGVSEKVESEADALVDQWRRNPTDLMAALSLTGPESEGWSSKLKGILGKSWRKTQKHVGAP